MPAPRPQRYMHAYSMLQEVKTYGQGYLLIFAGGIERTVPRDNRNRFHQFVVWWQEDGHAILNGPDQDSNYAAGELDSAGRLARAIALELAELAGVTPAQMRAKLIDRMRQM